MTIVVCCFKRKLASCSYVFYVGVGFPISWNTIMNAYELRVTTTRPRLCVHPIDCNEYDERSTYTFQREKRMTTIWHFQIQFCHFEGCRTFVSIKMKETTTESTKISVKPTKR